MLIQLSDLSLSRNGSDPILSHVDFHAEGGDFIYITGKVGTGKTSLLKVLYGELRPSEGKAEVLGNDLFRLKRRHLPLCEDFFLKRGCEFLGGEIVEMAEDVIQQSACFLGCVFGGVEFLDVVEIGVSQFVDDVVGCLGIIFLNVVSDFDELIGGAGHGGEYDNFLFSIVDELAHAFHAFRGTHGGSAKFQDFHVLYI